MRHTSTSDSHYPDLLNYENEARILHTCAEYNEFGDSPTLECVQKSNLGLAIKLYSLLNDCHTMPHCAPEIV
jgi:hypothetical protein